MAHTSPAVTGVSSHLFFGLRAFLLMLRIFGRVASVSLCCRNALNVSRVGEKKNKKKPRSEISQPCFFLFLFSPSPQLQEMKRAELLAASPSLASAARLTSSSVNSPNLNRNRRACGSAGAALKLQVSLFKTRLPGNISTLQQRRGAPCSHYPTGPTAVCTSLASHA